jgi:hypothetical protein
MRAFLLILTFCFATTAAAFQPRIGLWGNTSEGGSGYMIDIQNGTVVLTAYSYEASGPAQWYLASGPLLNGGHGFSATLDKYVNGQCISCPYRAATLQGNDGSITINFVSETLATLSLPGGRTTTIQAFDFGYGPLPAGMFGEWIFVYDNGGTTFANRYNFTTTVAATSTGSGIATDVGRVAGCELQISGSLAGSVICVDGDLAGNLQNGFVFRYGLDETFGGVWVSPSSGSQSAMKGFRVTSKDGTIRRSDVPPDDGSAHPMKMSAAAATADKVAPGTIPPEFAELAARLRGALREARQ